MRKTMIVLMVLVMAVPAMASLENALPIVVPITDVTVYPDQARITRTTTITLAPGENTFTIEGLPAGIQASSFQASVFGTPATLLGITPHIVYHTEAMNAKTADLRSTLYELERFTRTALTDRIESFTAQKKMLTSIQATATRDQSQELETGKIDVQGWNDAYSFIGRALRETSDSIRTVNRELDSVDNRIKVLKAQLDEIKTAHDDRSITAELAIMASLRGTATISVEYVIPGARWTPVYDARLSGDADEVVLGCFARVSQSSGEDWNEVNLTLSTAQPAAGTGPGDLWRWRLALSYPDRIAKKDVSNSPSVVMYGMLDEEIVKTEGKHVYIRGGRAGQTTYLIDGVDYSDPLNYLVAQKSFSTSFKIINKETIKSGEQPVKTKIGDHTLDFTMKLLARPRNVESVFRQLTLTNTDDAPLLPGIVSIFAEGDYLGQALLTDWVASGQSFDLPFGVDNNVSIKREIKDYMKSEKGEWFNSGKIRIKQTIEITLANHSGKERTIVVEEPLPIPQDDKVKVRCDDITPKPLENDDADNTTWELTMAPGQETTLSLPIQIEYPNDAQILGL